MAFEYQGKSCKLHRISLRALQLITGSSVSKCFVMKEKAPTPKLLTTGDQTILKMIAPPFPDDLANLLNEFEDVFQVPKTLAPTSFMTIGSHWWMKPRWSK